MHIQRVNRTDPEKVFIVVKNSYSTAALTVGQAVCFDYTTDADGVGVTQPTTALIRAFAGIVTATIAAGDYGLVQCYGHNADALVDGTTGLGVGDGLRPTNASFALSLTSTEYGFLVMGQTYSTGAAAAKKVFIRAM